MEKVQSPSFLYKDFNVALSSLHAC